MKAHALVVCMMALAWHISVRPSLAAGTEPPLHTAERPIAAAIAAAGTNFSHLLSQTGSNRMSAGRETKILLAAAIGFGAGFGFVYFKNDGPFDRYDGEQAAMVGTALAAIAVAITYHLTRP